MKDKKETLRESVEALTEKPLEVRVDVLPQNRWHKLLMKCKLAPKQYHYILKPVYVGNMYRIAATAEQLPVDTLVGHPDEVQDKLRKMAAHHMENIIYIVAVGLQNDRNEPSKKLLDTIRFEFTAADLVKVLAPIMHQLNLSDFMRSIVFLKGMTILRNPTEEKTSLITTGEIIAPSQTPGEPLVQSRAISSALQRKFSGTPPTPTS